MNSIKIILWQKMSGQPQNRHVGDYRSVKSIPIMKEATVI